uniref:Tachykinin 1 n=1 Tax=Nothobranchius furzeri TaxID=105023 RepID=A0A8C6PVG2_NOTFU
DPFRKILLRMTRKPPPRQFIGLMGKRSMGDSRGQEAAKCSAVRIKALKLRHKVNSFVGLMGKRSQEEPESYEWSTIQTYDKRR